MGFTTFFINRPIFASVLAMLITLLGGISIPLLPVEQTPDITPPTVRVSTSYPGADATVVARTVAAPIEEQVNGVDDMLYMSSVSGNDGSMTLTVTFRVGTDIDLAAVKVQNRVAAAEAQLPEDVKRLGVITRKQSTSMVMVLEITAPGGDFDSVFLSNYAKIYIVDELNRLDGVGNVTVFGARDFCMRIWLDPTRLEVRGLTVDQVIAAVREQNVQVAAGQIGLPPVPTGQELVYVARTRGRLETAEEFGNIILKSGTGGSLLRLKDVAHVERGAVTYSSYAQHKGSPCAAIGIFQLPGANALAVSEAITATIEELAERFPKGVEYEIGFDATRYIDASIREVLTTLLFACVLVVLTIFVFLQNVRTTIIPTITIPVSLIGTFAVMLALGISINTFSLFGLVLAIGIVVDDAIVVTENTMRIINEEGLSAREAATKAMGQIATAIVATTLVLLAVFVPSTMIAGISGRLYRQFAITISVATVFSSINALTLSPALCALFLRPSPKRPWAPFRLYNRFFAWTTRRYMDTVTRLIRKTATTLLIFLLLSLTTAIGLVELPTGFLPEEDQGYLIVNVELPEGASLERTERVLDEINGILEETPGVRSYITLGGRSLMSGVSSTNGGTVIVPLKDWSERRSPSLSAQGLQARLMERLATIEEGICLAFIPPSIRGLGFAGGFQLELQSRGADLEVLESVANEVVQRGDRHPLLTRMSSSFRATIPQLLIQIDREKVKRLDVPLDSLFRTLQAFMGSYYVNDFTIFGKTYQVRLQGDPAYRDEIRDFYQLNVRNRSGEMVPLGTVLTAEETTGPLAVTRFEMFPSASINGQAAPGFSSGEAMAAVEEILRDVVPPDIGYEWSGISFQEIQAGTTAPLIFTLAVLFVLLVLAAQYESWSIPIAVICSIPLALLGALAATWVRHYDNNIFMQIALVLLVGQASKTAILLVEFAKRSHDGGNGITEAALEACRLRFRPILMTAFSFIFGVAPLVLATGAGSAGRRSMGTAVFGGMLLATVLGVFMIPVFYVVVQRAAEGITARWQRMGH